MTDIFTLHMRTTGSVIFTSFDTYNDIYIFAPKFKLHYKSDMLRQWKINMDLYDLFQDVILPYKLLDVCK